jgi:hypothetical protein
MKILIDFDTTTNEVVSVEVNGVVKTPKTRKTKEKTDYGLLLFLEENKLVLTPALVELLGVKEGDKLIIRYKEDGGFIQPFLAPSSVFDEEGGNKLTKSLTVSFRGYQHDSLAKYGNLFEIEDMKDGSVKLLSNAKITEPAPISIFSKTLEEVSVIGEEDDKLTKTNFIIQ